MSSAIINVAQDVDEPWPLEVWGHDGKPYNITMEPGDMVLYESHSLIHGRPFPLKGNYYANVFVHYEVIGSKSEDGEIYLDEGGRESREAGLPPYIIPGSHWADEWLGKNRKGWQLVRVSIFREQSFLFVCQRQSLVLFSSALMILSLLFLNAVSNALVYSY